MGTKIKPNEKAISAVSPVQLIEWAKMKGRGDRKRAQKAKKELVKRKLDVMA